MTSQIPAEITFEDFRTGQPLKMIGNLSIEQLFDRETHWITLQNTIQHNKAWTSREVYISKSDIHQITFLEKHSFLSFENGKMFLKNGERPKAKVTQ